MTQKDFEKALKLKSYILDDSSQLKDIDECINFLYDPERMTGETPYFVLHFEMKRIQCVFRLRDQKDSHVTKEMADHLREFLIKYQSFYKKRIADNEAEFSSLNSQGNSKKKWYNFFKS